MKIFTVASLKGGSGKTTLSIFLAQALTVKGLKVLLIDLDHNNNSTTYSLWDSDPNFDKVEDYNVKHVITGEKEIRQTIFRSPHGYDIIPATPELHAISVDHFSLQAIFNSFERNVRSLPYDIVIIDTPPAFGFEMFCGLSACDVLVSPMLYFKWVVQGYNSLKNRFIERRGDLGKPIQIIVIPSGIRPSDLKKIEQLKIEFLSDNYIPSMANIKDLENKSKTLPIDTDEALAYDIIADELLMKFAPEFIRLEQVEVTVNG